MKAIRLFIVVVLVLILTLSINPAKGGTIRVPEDYPTIQAAINAAVTGDVILISPGTYIENLLIAGKAITLTSLFPSTGDRQYIDNTIIAGSVSYDPANPGLAVIRLGTETGTETNLENTIQGLTLKNGADGLKVFTKINILDNHITSTKDAVDLTDSGAVIKRNLIDFNTDDALDFDLASYGLVENNILKDNVGDGIEMRFHVYSGPTLNIVIRNNQIVHNNSDGIQLIRDWIGAVPPASNRVLTFEKNLIYNNRQAGLGLMDDMLTNEDYRGASLNERIYLFNNTIINNNYGVSGGDNMVAVNNIIANSKTKGVSNVDGDSTLVYNLLWNNVIDNTASNVDEATTLHSNPLLDANFGLLLGSPAIDTGTDHFEFMGSTVLDYPPGSYYGTAPDRGWAEMNYLNQPTPSITPSPTITPTPTPNDGLTFIYYPLDDATINATLPNSNFDATYLLNVDNSPVEDFLIKFQTTNLEGLTILKATLKLYTVNDSTVGGNFYPVLNHSWNEETVTWATAPVAETGLVASVGTAALNTWISVDLTSFISGNGILSLRASSTSTNAAKYSSKEGVNPPYLEIEVANKPGTTPQTPTFTATSSKTATPTHTATPTKTVTPTYTATLTNTATNTSTLTHTASPSPTVTSSPSPSPTHTKTATTTPSPTITDSPTSTRVPLKLIYLPIILKD